MGLAATLVLVIGLLVIALGVLALVMSRANELRPHRHGGRRRSRGLRRGRRPDSPA